MSTRVELETFLQSQIQAWSDIPCALLKDNETSQTVRDETEWMRLTVLDGSSFLQSSTGLLDVAGSTAAHPFVLRFDIFTPLHDGSMRAAEIGQAVSDYWAYRQQGSIHLDSATFGRVGEDSTLYHTAVTINAARYETLAVR